MARISKPPEERRQEFVDAARDLFLSRGYEHTAVSDIVQLVGVAQGLFYYYFNSKQDVMVAVVDQFIEVHIGELAKELRDEATPPLERIQYLMRMLSTFLHDLEALYPAGQLSTAIAAVIQNHVGDMMEPIVAELLRQGTEQGVLDAPYPDKMARFLIAGFIAMESMPNPPTADEIMKLIQITGRRLLGVPAGVLDAGAEG